MMQERRRYQRVAFGEEIILNRNIRARGLTLSEEGLSLRSGSSMSPRTVVELNLPLGGEMLTLRAEVRHSLQGLGMGLMLMDLSAEQRLTIRRYIEHLAGRARTHRNGVLLVDDIEMNRRMYKSRLVLDGFTVFEASNRKEALALLKDEKIGLVVINPYMAREDGIKLVSAIQAASEGSDTVVFVLAQRSTPHDIQRAKEAGAREFLFKISTSPARLSERVRSYLGC